MTDPAYLALTCAINAGAIALAEAIALATANPARLFPGLAPERGLLAPGKIADVVLADADDIGKVRTVVIAGKSVFQANSDRSLP